jgi:beta-phosphoglucomutase
MRKHNVDDEKWEEMTDAKAKAAIWDMDGTLVDTAELHFQAWQKVVHEYGRDFTRADFAATFGRRNPEIIEVLFGKRFNDAEVAALGDRKEVLYRDAARAGVVPLLGVRTLLEDLHRTGFLQAIGSSAPRANLDLILEVTDLKRYFQAATGMEDTERGKPDPQVFQVAAQRLEVAPARCVVFEDAVAGVQAARAAGMKCVAVRFAGHHPEANLRQAGADVVVDTLEHVTARTVEDLLG